MIITLKVYPNCNEQRLERVNASEYRAYLKQSPVKNKANVRKINYNLHFSEHPKNPTNRLKGFFDIELLKPEKCSFHTLFVLIDRTKRHFWGVQESYTKAQGVMGFLTLLKKKFGNAKIIKGLKSRKKIIEVENADKI